MNQFSNKCLKCLNFQEDGYNTYLCAFIPCLYSKSHLNYAINTGSILLKGMNSLWFIRKNLTANARVQNCVMCISVWGPANLNIGTYLHLPAIDGRNTRFQCVTLQAITLRRGEKY